MIQARFYKYSKRDNSTARPADSAGLVYNITLKEDTNINAPDLILYLGRSAAPDYNYVYIPSLKRYYFIDSWTYIEHANWLASCTVDVLATYKYDIGQQVEYVVRSASRRDGTIPDLLYPATNDVITQAVTVQSPFNDGSLTINDGCFIVGIDSYDAIYGSVDYYILTGNDVSDLCAWLMNDFIQSGGFSTVDATIALQRSLVNPMQFIKSCIWYPIPYSTMSALGVQVTLTVFAYSTGLTAYKLQNNAVYDMPVINITRLNHPQYNDHGQYMNCSPFTSLMLKLPPFGMIQLDPTVINAAGTVRVDMHVDLITGKVLAEVISGVSTVNRLSTQLGVPIQLSQVTRNYIGAVTSAAGAVSSLLRMDFIGAANGIGNAVQQAAPKVNSIGSNGGFADLTGDIELIYTFYMQADINNENHGKPLMQRVQLGTLSGYMEVESADIIIDCTAEERLRIVNYLEGGFYYE